MVRGKVVIRGTCVYLEVPLHGGPELNRIVWPRGTAWQEQSRSVLLRNGVVLRDGDDLYAGGGFVRDFELDLYLGDELAARAFDCDEAHGTQLLNDDLASWGEPPGELTSLVQGRLVFGRTCVDLRISNNCYFSWASRTEQYSGWRPWVSGGK